jgi:hypothetical protein
MRKAAHAPLPWWQVILGGIAVAGGIFGLLWSIVIIGWALEGVA